MFIRCLHCLILLTLPIFWLNELHADWQGGVAKANITPDQPMPMAGYASRGAEHASGKLTDLWAKALVIQDGSKNSFVLITLDLIGIDQQLSKSICDQLMSQHELTRDQIAINTSHTHTGPVVARNLRPMHYLLLEDSDRGLVDDYADFLEVAIISVVDEAFENLKPAEFSWSNSTATFAVNRRNNPAEQVPERRAKQNLAGPYDHDVPVLVMELDDDISAIIFGYACHCTTLSSFEWSGDYAGFAQQELEEIYPGATAMFWAGCGADQNPLPRHETELARRYGSHLAHAVSQAVESKRQPITGTLTTSYAEVALPFADLPDREELVRQSESSNKYEAARGKYHLDRVDSGETLSPTYPYPVQVIGLGETLTWIFLGGEVVVDFAISLKSTHGDSEIESTNLWVAGYSNDVMAYIPSRRVLLEGGYEGGGAMVYYGLPAVWSEQVESTILDEIASQLNQSLENE